jgi:hypothetical protein
MQKNSPRQSSDARDEAASSLRLFAAMLVMGVAAGVLFLVIARQQASLVPDDRIAAAVAMGAPGDRAQREESRRLAIANAKVINSALMMYVRDNRGSLPPMDGLAADSPLMANAMARQALTAYIQDTSVFEPVSPLARASGGSRNGSAFEYTFRGAQIGSLPDDARSKLELGFVSGPGGHAVIYADGHVKWRTDRVTAEGSGAAAAPAASR